MKARQKFRTVLLGSVLIFFLALTNSNAQSFLFEMPPNPDEPYLIQKYVFITQQPKATTRGLIFTRKLENLQFTPLLPE